MDEVVFETSGSTGVPKRVVRSEQALLADAQSLVAAFPEIWSGAPKVVASVLPHHMFGALWRVRAPRIAGCDVEAATVQSLEELAAATEDGSPVIFVTTPSFLEAALHHTYFVHLRGAFRAIVTSGSPLRSTTALAVFAATGVCPHEIYGSTEAGSVAWRRAVDGDEWTLLADVHARRLDDGRLDVRSQFVDGESVTMDDLVEFTASRKFRLLGRSNRQVKILERFVSLPAVEAALMESPLVAFAYALSYGEDIPRVGALVVLSKEGIASLASGGSRPLAAQLRKSLADKLDGVACPRRIRFVRTIPCNAQGKTTLAAATDALMCWCREPAVVEWRKDGDTLTAELVFPDDMECFQGHFPQISILPGVAQLYFLRHFAAEAFADFPKIATFKALKFQHVITPFERVTLVVTQNGDGDFSFQYSSAGGVCSSGRVVKGAQT